MTFELTPYQKSVLLALQNSGGLDDLTGICVYLQSVGWHELDLTFERIEIALDELKEIGLVVDLRD